MLPAPAWTYLRSRRWCQSATWRVSSAAVLMLLAVGSTLMLSNWHHAVRTFARNDGRGTDAMRLEDAQAPIQVLLPEAVDVPVPPDVPPADVQPGQEVPPDAVPPAVPPTRAPPVDPGPPPPTCGNAEECLTIVDEFLDQQPRHFGLLQVRALTPLAGGSCGELCDLPGPCPEGPEKCRHDTYDNALASIYYTKRGKFPQAKEILDAFIRILYPTSKKGMRPATLATLYPGMSSKHTLTLLASSYNAANEPVAGNYEDPYVTDGGVDAGNNAWAALAFAHYAAASGEACYATVARNILEALSRAGECEDALRGFRGHLEPYAQNYRSTEHNIDIFALAKVLGDTAAREQAGIFVTSQFARNPDYPTSYSTGTDAALACDLNQPGRAPVAADAVYWSLLADADPQESRINSALEFAFQVPERDAEGQLSAEGLWMSDQDLLWAGEARPWLNGTRFSSFGSGVQWEVTASAAMAMIHYQQTYGRGTALSLPQRIREARDSLKILLGMYRGVPPSVLGGNHAAWANGNPDSRYPGGSDTGLGWSYFRYLQTAPTAWTGLLLLFQADEGLPVNSEANPYATPAHPMPSRVDSTCLPDITVMP